MKKLLCLFLLAWAGAHAANASGSRTTTQTFTVTGSAYDVSFWISWVCDDFPMSSAPGRLELLDGTGNLLGSVAASDYGEPSVSVTGGGSVDGVVSRINRYAGGEPADGDLSGVWHITGLSPGTYTLRLWNYTTWDTLYRATTVWTHTSVTSGSEPTPTTPTNQPPAVTLLSPGDQTIVAGTTLTLSAQATDPDGNISNHNLDIQRPAGDWNWQGGFATGEPFQGGPVGNAGDSTRSANFTFTDVGTYQVRSAADDGSGWVQSATVSITVVAAPTAQYALVTSAAAGGTVSAGGTFDAGTVVPITATPDGTHDFAGWSGDAGGAANPCGVLMDGNKSVQANFSAKLFALNTSATAGGYVTPGGSYPYGASVTIAASPDASHRFLGWAGDAGGTVPSLVLTLTSALNVQAVFTDKTAQTITFASPGNQPVGTTGLVLTGSASSGLPLTYAVLSGPAVVTGNQLAVTGPGAITVQASQTGDAEYLAAASVQRTFNAVAAASLKYRPAGRTLLQASAADVGAPFVLERP